MRLNTSYESVYVASYYIYFNKISGVLGSTLNFKKIKLAKFNHLRNSHTHTHTHTLTCLAGLNLMSLCLITTLSAVLPPDGHWTTSLWTSPVEMELRNQSYILHQRLPSAPVQNCTKSIIKINDYLLTYNTHPSIPRIQSVLSQINYHYEWML